MSNSPYQLIRLEHRVKELEKNQNALLSAMTSIADNQKLSLDTVRMLAQKVLADVAPKETLP